MDDNLVALLREAASKNLPLAVTKGEMFALHPDAAAALQAKESGASASGTGVAVDGVAANVDSKDQSNSSPGAHIHHTHRCTSI